MTPKRAQEIIEAAKAKAVHGPWSDQLKKVMTAEENAAVLSVWDTMPGHTCYVDALLRIRDNAQPCDCCQYYDRPGFIFNAGAWMHCPQCNRQTV